MPAPSIIKRLLLATIAFATLPLCAQWQDVKTARVPRGPGRETEPHRTRAKDGRWQDSRFFRRLEPH